MNQSQLTQANPCQLNHPELLRNEVKLNNQPIQAKQSFSVTNPATMQVITQLPDLGEVETLEAIDSAQQALQTWQYSTADERYAVLMHWFDLIKKNRQDLGRLMSIEQGKPVAEAIAEVDYANSFVQWFAEQGRRILGRSMNHYHRHMELSYSYEPVGVVGVITPWNFPYAMITRKIAPAIAAGCTAVVKPSELTPLSALALAFLAEKAGLPMGVMNVITSTQSAIVGETLCAHALVRKMSFTGSTKVGKLLMKQSAETVKRVSMELGGNAPFIVFEDADLEMAADGLMANKFRNAGQTCVSPNRILVHRPVLQSFSRLLVDRVRQLKVGIGTDEGVNIGPLINPSAVAKAQRHVDNAVQAGAEILIGGKAHDLGGNFFQPTVLLNVPEDAIFCCEETFAPIVPIIVFDTEQQAIDIANGTVHGLASYFYSQDFRRIRRLKRALQSGIVGANVSIFSNVYGPFGGVKESGVGRESSSLGIDEYLNVKYCLENFA